MDSEEEKIETDKKTKVTLRLRQKVNDVETDQVKKPTAAKTSFNFRERLSPDPDEKKSVIDSRSLSPLGRFNKHWTSQSVPTSPTHTTHTRIYPASTSEWKRSPASVSSDDSSSVASNDSAFGSESSRSPSSSVKSWHPGINYKPTHPIYTMPTDSNNVFYSSSSRDSNSSGGSTTPTPGSPNQDDKTFPFGHTQSRSSWRKRASESAAQTQLNIEPKKFSEQDKHILEEYFPTSSKTSGPRRGTKNFINSAVFKEDRKKGQLDVDSLEKPQVHMDFSNMAFQEKRGDHQKKVLVFPENSPAKLLPKSANPRVSSLVEHFNIPSPKLSPKLGERNTPERPASAGRMATFSTLPRNSSEETKANINKPRHFSITDELVKSKPYETTMFQDASRRQSFLDNYLGRLQRNNTSSQLVQSNSNSPDIRRECYSSRRPASSANLSEMRPLSASALFARQDSFTNDPYKRKSFLNKYLSRQGQTQFISKKTV